YELQRKMNGDKTLDGALAERAIYDANSTLRLQGFVNDRTAHLPKLKAFLDTMAKERPPWLRTTTWLKGDVLTVEDVKVYPEPLRPAAFQKLLSANTKLLPRQTRVDRIHFDYDKTKLLFRVYGVSLHPDWPAQGAEPAGIKLDMATLFFMQSDP